MNLFRKFCEENSLCMVRGEKLDDKENHIFEKICEQEMAKRLSNDFTAIDYSWDYLQKGLIKLVYKLESGNRMEDLTKEFNVIFRNSITFALKKQNPNLAALTQKISEILKELVSQKKAYLYKHKNQDNVSRKASTKLYALIDSEPKLLFDYTNIEHKQPILDYIKETQLDSRYALIINEPTNNQALEQEAEDSLYDLEEREERIRTRNFNCRNEIRLVIEDFFTETKTPRTTAEYIWRAYQAARVIVKVYNDNYEIRIAKAKEQVENSKKIANEAIKNFQEVNTKDTQKYKVDAERNLENAQKKLSELEKEYRACFSKIKSAPIQKDGDDGKQIDNPEVNRNNKECPSFIQLEDDMLDENLINNWINDTINIISSMKETGRKGIIWLILKHLIEAPENDLGLEKEFCKRFITAYNNRPSTPTIFFAKILNVSEGTISSYSSSVQNFIKKRFMKFNQLSDDAEYQQENLDLPDRFNIPHLTERAMTVFWTTIADYFKNKIEVISL